MSDIVVNPETTSNHENDSHSYEESESEELDQLDQANSTEESKKKHEPYAYGINYLKNTSDELKPLVDKIMGNSNHVWNQEEIDTMQVAIDNALIGNEQKTNQYRGLIGTVNSFHGNQKAVAGYLRNKELFPLMLLFKGISHKLFSNRNNITGVTTTACHVEHVDMKITISPFNPDLIKPKTASSKSKPYYKSKNHNQAPAPALAPVPIPPHNFKGMQPHAQPYHPPAQVYHPPAQPYYYQQQPYQPQPQQHQARGRTTHRGSSVSLNVEPQQRRAHSQAPAHLPSSTTPKKASKPLTSKGQLDWASIPGNEE